MLNKRCCKNVKKISNVYKCKYLLILKYNKTDQLLKVRIETRSGCESSL